MEKLVLENRSKLSVPLFGAFAAPNKGTTILYGFSSTLTKLSHTVNSKIKELSKA